MNLLALLRDAARRVGVSYKKQANVHFKLTPDPDLEDRIRHGLGRAMNRRELFRFTAIAAAVGTPVVRELILSPAKTIVAPPAGGLYTLAEAIKAEYGGVSNAEVLAAQFEVVRPKLPLLYHAGSIFNRLAAQLQPHLDDMVHGSDPWRDLGYDPDEPFPRGRRSGLPPAADSERMVGGLYIPNGVELPAGDPRRTFVSEEQAQASAAEYDDYDDEPWEDYDDEED